ncbi:MAG: hypothetical protein JF609_10100 [Verrucomicrobia bacterium]|nr:hypothetical protein [Verrucomicrobiota bacterium]
MRILLAIVLLISIGIRAPAEAVPLHKLDRAAQAERIASDLKMVVIYRAGLSNATAFTALQTNLFPATPVLPGREDKEVLWQTWKSYLDYLLALDTLDSFYSDWWRLSGEQKEKAFAISYAAFLAKYRYGVEFVALAEKNPFLDTVLNEPVPELGLPAGTYAKLKFRFLNVGTATDFGARAALFKTMGDAATRDLQPVIYDDADGILHAGRGTGELLTAKNALNILKHTGSDAWFPVQQGVSEWMGHTKVYRRGEFLITPAQIEATHKQLLPGDVLLVRREWFMSNVGLPGFWPHAALYIGTPEERHQYFATPEMTAWVRAQGIASGDFEELLKSRYATNYLRSLGSHEQGHATRVIEAMSAGVSFTAIEHCIDADSMVALRPKLSLTDKAIAILRAMHYAGRPYDFNFDFATDSELVCTELVFKSYEPAHDTHGLHLPLTVMLGRQLLPANLIAKQFDEQYGTSDVQFEFLSFLDGHESEGKAVDASVEEFRKSWQRPKWHVLTQ